jgi:hypothetical protein
LASRTSPTAVPIDPARLVEAAREFARPNTRGRPRSTWLRRAVSSAYYALFHALCLEASRHLLPEGTSEQQLRLSRAFGHREMKGACAWVAGRQGNIHPYVKPLIASLKTTAIADVASSFCDLQEARHDADYDHLATLSKPAALAHVGDVGEGHPSTCHRNVRGASGFLFAARNMCTSPTAIEND